jgi:YD repeat-containing protein
VIRNYAALWPDFGTTMLNKLFAGTASVADITAITPVNNAADAVVRHIYDAAGRERYTLTQNSASTYLVNERRYDGAGRVTAQYQYAVPIALGAVATPADVGTALNAAGAYATADRYRSTQYVFDAAGRVRFTVDDLGAVNEQRFDGAGRVVETRRYGGYISISTPMNDAAVAAAVAAIAEVRTTTTTYDAMGRVLRVTDALNQYEEYTYNPLGQVTALRNKNGHVWNYEYDAAGRRTAEISPQVWIANVDVAGTQSYGVRRVVTRTEYDALGNVIRRLEDADGARPRITRYEYDNRGNQIRTIFPDAGKINPANGQLIASDIQPTIEITYDALGRAVAQKDVRGNYSYKVYDNLGRLAYDVDQENYVTAYGYDGFGQQTNLRRHAQTLNVGALAGWSPGQPLSMAQMQAAAATSASDRTIATRYDQRGLAVQIEQAQIAYYTSTGAAATGSPTVRIEYDGFGNKVKESILLEGTAGQADARWADTYTYYDLVGRVTMTVDAEGYVTRARYNATGEVVESIEYAKAVWTGGLSTAAPPALPSAGDEISGYDRITRLSYDALGRKISESVVRHFQRNDGSSGVRDVVTQFRYDGADRVTQIINDAGTTSTEYDALGHAVSVTEPTRKVINDGTFGILAQNTGYDLNHPNVYADASPYTGMIYDAFGNLVLTRRFASGKNAAGQVVEDANKDQIERVRYDWQGRAVATSATNGDTAYTDYDAADNVSHRWYVLSGTQASRDVRVHTWYSYDKAGRQTGVGQTRDLINGGGSSTDLSEAVVYNAFGEIVQKTYAGVTGSLNYAYDAAGRLVTSNENFGARNFGYNLAGHQVRESHVVVISDGQTGGGRQSVDATTFNTTDRLGRTTATRLPSNTTDPNATLSVQQRLDRWGNVLEVIDARGYQTNYRYNESNQVTRDERPLAEVVSDTGQSSWLRPINYWFYDALGRLIGTRDANGNTRTNQYDAVGRMVSSKDALGQATLFAYDALGNQRITQNPLGYLTYKDYDALGRLVEIGDYLANGAGGRTRTALQRYWLNQNGDRIVVTDALNKQALYDFDGRHLLLRSQTAAGVVTGYAYDMQGRKILETNARSGSSTLTDRDGESVRVDELSWNYDVYGRLIDHNNLSGRDFDYAYDPITGQLTAESQSGGPAAYSYRFTTYYADGRVKALHENGAAPTYRYEYDAAGNRTVEEVNTTDGGGLAVRTVTRTWYDSQNRIARVVQDDLASGKRVFDMSYSYDAVGNRRRVKAAAAYGPDAGGIEVTNNAPTVTQAPAPRSLRRGMTSQFTLLFSDIFRDAEQDPLTLQITLADGSALPAWLSVQRDASTGRITFTANPPANLPDQALTVLLTAYETHQPTKQIATSFSLSVSANARPQRHNDAVETIRIKTGQAWNKDLLATDLFYDLDVGDRLRLSLDNPGAVPAWMSLDANNPGALRLSGVAQTGTYTFTVRATDEMGGAEIKTVQIIVAPNNAPGGPVPLPPKTAMVGRDFNWSLGVSAAFSDADGDPLEIVASGLPAWMTFQRVRIQGRDEIRLIGRVPDSAVGGTNYTIAFTATDPEGASRTTTLSVTLRSGNSNPTAPASIYPPPAVIGHYYWYQLPAFTDADGDAMTYGVVPYAVANLPPGLSFDAATRTISGTLTQASSEPLNVIYIATDEYGGRTATSFVLHTRGNAAPVASSIPNQSAGVGVNWIYSLPPFSDANYDPVSYTATGLPPGLWLNANAQIVGTPSTAGSYGVTVVGTDPYGASASTYFVITVNAAPPPNRAPQINPARPIPGGEFYSTNRWLVERQDMSFPGDIFIDPDGNPLTYSFVELPGWLSYSYSPQYGHILGGYPPGQTITERIIMRAQDPSGAYVDLTFYVHTTYDHYDPGNPTDPTSLPNPVSVVAADANTFEMGASVLAESGAETSLEQLQSPAANTMSATAAAASAGPVPTQVKEFWYTYDAENRIKINNGQMVNGQIQLVSYGEDSYELVYDAGGRAVTRINLRPSGRPGVYNLWLERFDFDLRGNRTVEYWEQVIGPPETRENGVRKVLTYDANNRLTGTRSYFGASEYWDHTSGGNENGEFYQRYYYGGWLMSSENYEYDADGRLMYQETRQRNTSQPDWVRLAGGDQITTLGVLEFESNADYRLPADGSVTSGYDAAGRLMRYSISGKGYIHTYTSTYVGWESYLQGSVTGTSSDNNYRTTTNTLSYDAFGRLMSQREVTPLKNGSIDDRMRYYGYNGDGSVQTRREGSLSNNVFTQNGEFGPGNDLLVHAGGQQQAELKQGFAIARADQTLYYTDQIQSLSGRGNYEAGGGNLVSAVPGETLREMAKRVYGSDQMWYVLANANGLGNPDQELAAGTQLIAPNATVSGNDANTFKPYNPADAIGSTTPNLPYIPIPSGPNSCNKLTATLIRVVATVISAVFPVAAPVVMPLGEAVAQKYENNVGLRQGYSLGAIASAYFTAQYIPAGKGFWGAVQTATTRAAISYDMTYAIDKTLGQDASFSLRDRFTGIATAGVGAAIGYIGTGGPSASTAGGTAAQATQKAATHFRWGEVVKQVGRTLLREGTTYGVKKAVYGSEVSWDWGQALLAVASDAVVTGVGLARERAAFLDQKAVEVARYRARPGGEFDNNRYMGGLPADEDPTTLDKVVVTGYSVGADGNIINGQFRLPWEIFRPTYNYSRTSRGLDALPSRLNEREVMQVYSRDYFDNQSMRAAYDEQQRLFASGKARLTFNLAIDMAARPIVDGWNYVRAPADAAAIAMQDGISSFESRSAGMVDDAGSGFSAAALSAPNAINRSVAAIGHGLIDKLRMVTNTDHLINRMVGIENVLSARPQDTFNEVSKQWQALPSEERAQLLLDQIFAQKLEVRLPGRSRGRGGVGGDDVDLPLRERLPDPVVGSRAHIDPAAQNVADEWQLGRTADGTYGACFLPGTLVHTKLGVKPIEQIVVGDWVASRNQYNQQTQWRLVLQTFATPNKEAVHIDIRHEDGTHEVISCTNEHPFYVYDRSWTGASSLQPGDRLKLLNDERSTVVAVTALKDKHTVYNFEVDTDHTYFVGGRGVWVHNASRAGDIFDRSSNVAEETLSLPPGSPGKVIRNSLDNLEYQQALDLVEFRGGVFEGAPKARFPGIDGWLDGTPVSLKRMQSESIFSLQRNIVKGADSLAKQNYIGDIALDATFSKLTFRQISEFVKPGSPIGNILGEGVVNNVYIKTRGGWMNITRATISAPGE